jgi:hypothetical protein
MMAGKKLAPAVNFGKKIVRKWGFRNSNQPDLTNLTIHYPNPAGGPGGYPNPAGGPGVP